MASIFDNIMAGALSEDQEDGPRSPDMFDDIMGGALSEGASEAVVSPSTYDPATWKGFPTKHPSEKNKDGSRSNVLLGAGYEFEMVPGGSRKKAIVFPSMVGGERLSEDEAKSLTERYIKDGAVYPTFNTMDEAVAWSQKNHADISEAGILVEGKPSPLGNLDPANWGAEPLKLESSLRAATLDEIRGPEPAQRSMGDSLPLPWDIVSPNAPKTGNSFIDSVNGAVGVATTFGMAGAAANNGAMGGLVKAAGATTGAPKTGYKFEGKALSDVQAGKLRANTRAAEEHNTRVAGWNSSPENTTFVPGRSYRRVGTAAGLASIRDKGRVLPADAKAYGSDTYYNANFPSANYLGPYTVEVGRTPDSLPGNFKWKNKVKANHKGELIRSGREMGYLHDKRKGTPVADITRIFHDDGTVIYSRTRDGVANFNKIMDKHLAGPSADYEDTLGGREKPVYERQ
jgi:hypothetical protein